MVWCALVLQANLLAFQTTYSTTDVQAVFKPWHLLSGHSRQS